MIEPIIVPMSGDVASDAVIDKINELVAALNELLQEHTFDNRAQQMAQVLREA